MIISVSMRGRKSSINVDAAITLYKQGGQTIADVAREIGAHTGNLRDIFRRRGIRPARITPRTPPTEKLLYYAGFFDGEGHITLAISNNKEQPSYWLQIGVTGTVFGVLEDFQSDFGCGHFSETYGIDAHGKRRCKTWRCTSNQAAHVLKCMLPYLRVKKEQAILAIQFQEKMATRTDTTNGWKQECKERLLQLKQVC